MIGFGGNTRRRRSQKSVHGWRPAVECLESRRLLTEAGIVVEVTDGTLFIRDEAGDNNDISVRVFGDRVQITDPAANLTARSGTQIDNHTVDVPLDLITSRRIATYGENGNDHLRVRTRGGVTLAFSFSGGDGEDSWQVDGTNHPEHIEVVREDTPGASVSVLEQIAVDWPLDGIGNLAISDDHQLIFVSGSHSRDSRVAVFDFEGQHVTTLEDIPGAYGLYVENDLLYVAATEANQIFEFSLPSFELRNQFSTGPYIKPTLLTKVDGDVFVSVESTPFQIRMLLRIDTQGGQRTLTDIRADGYLRNSIHDPNTFYSFDFDEIKKVNVTEFSATVVETVRKRAVGPVLDDIAVEWWSAHSPVDSGYHARGNGGRTRSSALELFAADDNRLLGSIDLQGTSQQIHGIEFDRDASHLVVVTPNDRKLRIIRLSEHATAVQGQTSLGVAPDVESVLIRTAGGDDSVNSSRLADMPVSLSIETGAGDDSVSSTRDEFSISGGTGIDTVSGGGQHENLTEVELRFPGRRMIETSPSTVQHYVVPPPSIQPQVLIFDGTLVVRAHHNNPIDVNIWHDEGSGEVVVDSASVDSLGALDSYRFSKSSVDSISVQLSDSADRLNIRGLELPVYADGRGGNDTLVGSMGDDCLLGGDGNDLLLGGGGRDTLQGQSGNDRVKGQGGVDWLDGGEGIDTLDGGAGDSFLADQIDGEVRLTIDGYETERGDRAFTGGRFQRTTLTGGAGDDTLNGSGYSTANLILNGLEGNDVLVGGSQGDFLDGGDGNDTLLGGAAGDRLVGGNGNDRLRGQGSFDTLGGGQGDDYLDGGPGGTVLREEVDGNISVTGSAGEAAITGIGNDRLIGDYRAAILVGGDSPNRLDVSGFDRRTTLISGAGNDELVTGPAGSLVIPGAGDDRIISGSKRDRLTEVDSHDEFQYSRAVRLNLSNGLTRNRLRGLRQIDLRGGGRSRIDVSISDVAAISSSDSLIIRRDAGDRIILLGDMPAGEFRSMFGSPFRQYRSGDIELWIESPDDITSPAVTIEELVPGQSLLKVEAGPEFAWEIHVSIDSSRDQAVLQSRPLVEGEVFNFDTQRVPLGDIQQLEVTLTDQNDILSYPLWNFSSLIHTGAGNDTITSGTADDTILGEGGFDRIDAGAGYDQVSLVTDLPGRVQLDETGIVAKLPRSPTETVMPLTGVEAVELENVQTNSDLVASQFAGSVTLIGTVGNDTLTGAQGDDLIIGRGGNDTVYASSGNDTIQNAGTLHLIAETHTVGSQNLTLTDAGLTGTGTSTLVGTDVHVVLRGDEYDNVLDAIGWTGGSVELYGEDGNDTLLGSSGDDTLMGEDGDDSLVGFNGQDSLWGSRGADTLTGGAGDDIIRGDNSDTLLEEGDFDFRVTRTELIGNGRDILGGVAQFRQVTLILGDGNNSVDASEFGSPLYVDGKGGDDTLTGAYAHSTLFGGAGNDSLTGDRSDDELYGGQGDDTLHGNGGDDQLEGAEGNDLVGGQDGDDLIAGESGNDTLDAGAGDDSVSGGPGDDLLTGEGRNIWLEVVEESPDLVYSASGISGMGSDTVDNTFIGLMLIGDDRDNVLDGSLWPFPLVMFGGGGNDILTAGNQPSFQFGDAGNDTLNGSSDRDTLRGGAGNDFLRGKEGADSIAGDEGIDLILGGSDLDTLLGGEGADVIQDEADSQFDRDPLDTILPPGTAIDAAVLELFDLSPSDL